MAFEALLVVADGSEEMEIVITADVLRRAGILVIIADLEGKSQVKCSREVVIVPDESLKQLQNKIFDVIILPGGLVGAVSMSKCELLGKILKNHEKQNKLIAAICAAPMVLKVHEVGLNHQITSHPSIAKEFVETNYIYKKDRVVEDRNLITSQAPGTTFEFALKIVTKLFDAQQAEKVALPMLL